MNPDFEIIGTGNIGEKARQLVEKTPQLREIGFCVPKRTVLAEDFFDEFFQRNGLGSSLSDVTVTPDLEAKIRDGTLSQRELETLQRVCSSYDDRFLIVRSSAQGDARGTGTYESKFSLNHIGKIRKRLQQVLASYFSETAIAFRRDSHSGEGFGVIVEPVVGQQFGDFVTPVYSGYGYTSTSKGAGYINLVFGLTGGVTSKKGARITEELVLKTGDDWWEILFRISRLPKYFLNLPTSTYFGEPVGHSLYGKSDQLSSNCRVPVDQETRNAMRNLKLMPLFERMRRVEEFFGRPQYFEWAMIVKNDQPKWYVLQIADVDKKTDVFEFGSIERVVFDCNQVTGSGIREVRKMFECFRPEDIPRLYDFNQNNRDYALIFSSKLTTISERLWQDRKLTYRDFSNATVFMEFTEDHHQTGDPLGHLDGQLDATDKFFGAIDYSSGIEPNWDLINLNKKKEFGSTVYQGRFKVIASERQDRMQVIALD